MTSERVVASNTAPSRAAAARGRYLLLSPVLVLLLGAFTMVAESSDVIPQSERLDSSDLIWVVAYAVAAGTGAVILNHVPGHLVGWAQLGYGLVGGVAIASYGVAVVLAGVDAKAAAAVVEGVGAAILTAGFLLLPASLLLFPPGGLPSARWRPVAWVMVVAAAIGAFAALVTGQFGGDSASETAFGPGPLTKTFGGAAEALSGPFFLLLLVSIIGAAVSLLVRYRRSIGDERLQIKWVVTAGAFLAVVAVLVGPGVVTGGSEVLLAVGLAAVPVAMALAIIKYKLFDIDVVISRSLTFGVLVAFIGVVYVAIVVGVGELFGGGATFGLSVAATAVVAIAFQPVRTRVERWANRLVYGKRATPYEVLARFSHRAAEESDGDVLDRIPRLIVDGTGASVATLWVRVRDGFRSAARWPESDAGRRLDGGAGFEDPDADVSLPVFHDGDLLGGISLVTARGGTITPPEQELVTSLADGLGLTLRNSQLTEALRRQIKDLQRSRDRVVSAADEARRSLEHDLDSGPQQHLVAVKVKLGSLRKLAEQAGAAKTADLLTDIEVQAGDAIQSVRDFAAGIYPPLLGAEGLAVALGQETRRAALPIDLDVDGVGRYPRDVEAAVYFSILEALQNTAKYSEASRAVVRLRQTNGDLSFEVIDDGHGFDPAATRRGAGLNGITDRIDTIGGTCTVASAPGTGTTVSGSVPVRDAPNQKGAKTLRTEASAAAGVSDDRG